MCPGAGPKLNYPGLPSKIRIMVDGQGGEGGLEKHEGVGGLLDEIVASQAC